MRFPFRLSPGVRGLAVIAFALTVIGLGGACEDKHIGRRCELGVPNPDAGASGTTATITSPALECPSRICILPAATRDPNGTGPLCTAECENNDDCSEGETGPSSGSGPLCKTGFACLYPTTVGPFCCRKMCVCRDFLGAEPAGGYPKPEACNSAAGGCKNL